MSQSPLNPRNDDEDIRSQNAPLSEPTGGPSRPLTFDEMVAMLVAFVSLGSVLFWGFSRGQVNLFSGEGPASPPAVISPEAAEGRAEASGTPGSPGVFSWGTKPSGPQASAPNTPGGAPEQPTSARETLARQAETRQAQAPERASLWDDLKAGMTGAAAGVAGVAIGQGAATPSPTPAGVTPAEPTPAGTPTPATPQTAKPDSAASPAATPTRPADSAPMLSAAATSAPKAAVKFNDLPDNYWAKPYIDALSSRGLISGYKDGTYKPDQPVTRAQIANIVSRTFELQADQKSIDFTDVGSDYWAKDSIAEVVKGGFMKGFPNNTFSPEAPVTRAQALTTLVTGLKLETPTNVQTALSRYTDANAIPKWANEKIAAATAGNLVVNYPKIEELEPTAPTTRAELAAMIYQALANEGVVEPVNSQYLVKP